MYIRKLQKTLQEYIFKRKIIIIYGARQVGKTTLVNNLLTLYPDKSKVFLNGDESNTRNRLKPTSYEDLFSIIGNPDFLIIDEAQRIENIGLILKIIYDNNPSIQIIATGSSSFDLANKINEPLTGRSLEFKLFPLSISEVCKNGLEFINNLPKILKFGSYPGIFSLSEKPLIKNLTTIQDQYLYKDLLEYEDIKKPSKLPKLLQLLALQIGNEVSVQELGQKLEIDKKTVEKYIDLLEKSFVIFSLSAFAKNLRNEVVKTKKIYFYDLGIRNSLIGNFNNLDLRNDLGGLWENFCILEIKKKNEYSQTFSNSYFWRNYAGQEVDYIEVENDSLKTFEFKWGEGKKPKLPNIFSLAYKSTFQVLNPDNFWQFIG